MTVTDDGTGNLTDSETFTITVNDTNVAPVLAAIGNQAVNEGSPLSFTASATDADLPSQTLTYALDAASLALGMSINSSTGVFSWTPTEAQGGTAPSVTVTVTDNGIGNLTDSQTFTITVAKVNNPPTTSPVTLSAIAEDSGARLITQAELLLNASDIDGPTLTATGLSISAGNGSLVDNGNGTWSYTPALNDDTSVGFSYSVTDGTTPVAGSATLDITPVNDAPFAMTPAQVSLNENSPAGTLVATVIASDPDVGDLFTFALLQDAGGRFAIDPNSGRILVTPGALLDLKTQTGFDLQLRVTDAGGLSYVQALRIDLRDLPEGPVTPPAPVPAPQPVVLAAAGAPAALPPTPPIAAPAPPVAPPAAPTAGAGAPGAGKTTLGSTLGAPAADDDSPRGGLSTNANSQTIRLRVRDEGTGPVASISFDNLTFDTALPLVSIWDEASKGAAGAGQRDALLAYGSAAVEAGTAQASAEAAPAPSTLIDMAQDPVRIASVTFTAGLVWWLTRSGGLLTTMLLGVPAWRHVDLLPVLASPPEDEEDDEDSRQRGGRDAPSNAADNSALAELSDRKSPGISPAPPPRRKA